MSILRNILFALLALLTASDASAQPLFLQRVTHAEGHEIIANLQHLQRQLRSGKSEFFQLYSGGGIGSWMTRVPPREAFLEIPFENTWSISRAERRSSDPWKRYTLIVAHKLRKLACTVSVGVGEAKAEILSVKIDCAEPPRLYPPPSPL